MFLYTFSGSIIEEDEALEELEADKRPGENSIFMNNFKMSVNDTVELFKGKCPVKNDLYNAYWPNMVRVPMVVSAFYQSFFFVYSFLGTSATIVIDGQINKVCSDYKNLSTKDSKRHALSYMSSNLGILVKS